MSSKLVQNAIAVVRHEATQICEQKLVNNVWSTPSRGSPNGEKLQHGAIQRMSVSVSRENMRFTHMNPEKIGVYKRPELNTRCSTTAHNWSAPWDTQSYRNRIARIYMPQKKHVHNHPFNKSIGKYWQLDFESYGSYKSPLMGWTSGSHDAYNTVQVKFGKLQDAVAYAESNGWGYDIMYPTNWRWHTKKNYVDNFAWKGNAVPEENYD